MVGLVPGDDGKLVAQSSKTGHLVSTTIACQGSVPISDPPEKHEDADAGPAQPMEVVKVESAHGDEDDDGVPLADEQLGDAVGMQQPPSRPLLNPVTPAMTFACNPVTPAMTFSVSFGGPLPDQLLLRGPWQIVPSGQQDSCSPLPQLTLCSMRNLTQRISSLWLTWHREPGCKLCWTVLLFAFQHTG